MFNTGDWVCILGACGDATTMRNSYGTGGFASNVLGKHVTLNRLTHQFNLVTSKGLGAISDGGSGNIGRVKVWVSPPKGLFAGFDATPKIGAAPLKVQFNDTTSTSATGGVTSWAWDFDGDSKVDATVQNPKFVYTPGFYDVSLSVSNAGGSDSITKKGYIAALKASQKLQTLPKGFVTLEGNSSTSYLWGRSNSALGHRIQYCYDKAYISSPGPVMIQALWFRCNAGTYTWTGGTFNNVTVQLSTCPVAYTAIGRTFANNHGADVKTCFSGNVTVKPQTTASTNSPQTWCVQVNLSTPFMYDPSKGDLMLDFTMPGPLPTTQICYALDAETSTNNNSRYVYNYSDATAPTGSPYKTQHPCYLGNLKPFPRQTLLGILPW